jgi:hypothetical protein
MSAFQTLPFQTERVNSALEGLIVINYTLLTTRRRRCRRRSPQARSGANPLWDTSVACCLAGWLGL